MRGKGQLKKDYVAFVLEDVIKGPPPIIPNTKATCKIPYNRCDLTKKVHKYYALIENTTACVKYRSQSSIWLQLTVRFFGLY